MPLDAPRPPPAPSTSSSAQPLGLGARRAPPPASSGSPTSRWRCAVRSITTERGLDPRDYALVAYGGGGPLHAVAIARELGIPRVVVPPSPSTFSAWGMLATDLRHDLVRTVLEPLEATDAAWAGARYRGDGARDRGDPAPVGAPVMHRAADLRYLGQEHTVTVARRRASTTGPRCAAASTTAHQRAYGYAAPDVDVQLLNLRLAVVFPLEPRACRRSSRARPVRRPLRDAQDLLDAAPAMQEYRVYQRDELAPATDRGAGRRGGAGTTTIIEAADTFRSKTRLPGHPAQRLRSDGGSGERASSPDSASDASRSIRSQSKSFGPRSTPPPSPCASP